MAKQVFVNGNSLVTADGSELGLSESSISIAINPKHLDVQISTFGNQGVPGAVQKMLADAYIQMALVYFDPAIVQACLLKSIGGASLGAMPVAGELLTSFVNLHIASPMGGLPWTFPSAYLTGNPLTFPIGNERTVCVMNFRAIPYKADPSDATGAVLFTNS